MRQVLCVPTERLSCTLSVTWEKSTKTLTSGVACAVPVRLSGWTPRNSDYPFPKRWLETVDDTAQCHSHWSDLKSSAWNVLWQRGFWWYFGNEKRYTEMGTARSQETVNPTWKKRVWDEDRNVSVMVQMSMLAIFKSSYPRFFFIRLLLANGTTEGYSYFPYIWSGNITVWNGCFILPPPSPFPHSSASIQIMSSVRFRHLSA